MLACTLLLAGIERIVTSQLSTQQLAKRWSEEEQFTQLSIFFAKGKEINEAQIMPIEQAIKTALEEASIDASADNGRKWVDAYSSKGELTLSSDRTSATVRAYGVSKDFFLFHPLTLLSGTYFGLEDENEDGLILDENVAWQLFGSNNVAGLTVEINGISYVVRGVVRSEEGLFSEKVEENIPTVYVSFSLLERHYGSSESGLPIENYELLIANPVRDFGETTLKNAVGGDENAYVMVENTTRYQLMNRLTMLKDFTTSTMSTKAVEYPYWENRARGYETISLLIMFFEIVCLIYPIIYAIQLLHKLWKKKHDIWVGFKDFVIEFYKAHRKLKKSIEVADLDI